MASDYISHKTIHSKQRNLLQLLQLFHYRQCFDDFPLFVSSMDVCTISQLEIMNIRKMVLSTHPCHFVRSSTEMETSILEMRRWTLMPKWKLVHMYIFNSFSKTYDVAGFTIVFSVVICILQSASKFIQCIIHHCSKRFHILNCISKGLCIQ